MHRRSRFNSWWGQEISIFSRASKLDVQSIHPPVQWMPGGFFLQEESWGMKLTSTYYKVKKTWSYTSTPPYIFMA
jgi:hypothetical protein